MTVGDLSSSGPAGAGARFTSGSFKVTLADGGMVALPVEVTAISTVDVDGRSQPFADLWIALKDRETQGAQWSLVGHLHYRRYNHTVSTIIRPKTDSLADLNFRAPVPSAERTRLRTADPEQWLVALLRSMRDFLDPGPTTLDAFSVVGYPETDLTPLGPIHPWSGIAQVLVP